MCRKAASRHSKTLGMDTVLPNHPALGATLTPLSARASGFRAFPANACRATCASGFRETVVPLSQPKTTVNNIVLGVVQLGKVHGWTFSTVSEGSGSANRVGETRFSVF